MNAVLMVGTIHLKPCRYCYELKAKPLSSLPIDAVKNKEGELERIGHWANKCGSLVVQGT